jgi:hypothetical protein
VSLGPLLSSFGEIDLLTCALDKNLKVLSSEKGILLIGQANSRNSK